MKRKGFTLIELMVVVAIIGLLAAIALPKFSDVSSQAKVANVQGNLATARTSIAMFYAKSGSYPGLLEQEDALASVTGTDTDGTAIKFTDFYGKSKMAETPASAAKIGEGDAATTLSAKNDIVATAAISGGWVYTAADGTIKADLPDNAYNQNITWSDM